VDGGLTYLGSRLTDASMDLDIIAIDDNVIVFNVLESSIVNGSNVVPGGYQGVTAEYKRHNFGWFDNRNGYYFAQSLCVVSGQCLTEGFFEENQSKLMVYAQSPTLGLTVWLVSGNDASPRAAAMVETAFFTTSSALRRTAHRSRSTGNRGTGLSPGAWKVDGGLTYLGSRLTDASMDLDIIAIDDNVIVFNVLESSIVNGSNVVPGGYQGVTAEYKRHNFGWFDNRNGYYFAQSLCVVSGQCLTEGFFEENQSKLMVYAQSPTLGLTVWLVSGNDASPRAAAMVETTADKSRSTGNRGTGLSPGAWKVDGGLTYLGSQLTDASMDLDIVAIDDNVIVFNVLESSIVNGSNVIPGGYQGVTAEYKRHNFGWFDNRNGYYFAQSLCVNSGQCLTEGFFEENQSKLMVYARSPTLGLTVWLVSGNDATPRAAAMVETESEIAEGAGIVEKKGAGQSLARNRGGSLTP